MPAAVSQSFQAYLRSQLEDVSRRLLNEYEKKHGDSSSEEDLRVVVEGTRAQVNGHHQLRGRGDDAPSPMSEGLADDCEDEFAEGDRHIKLREVAVNMHTMKTTPASGAWNRLGNPDWSVFEEAAVDGRSPWYRNLSYPPEDFEILPAMRRPGSVRSDHSEGEPNLDDRRSAGSLSLARTEAKKITGSSLAEQICTEAGLDIEELTQRSQTRSRNVEANDEPELYAPQHGQLDGYDDTGRSSYFQEERQKNCSDDWIIFPGSWFYRSWSNAISFLVLMSCFFTPMRFGFRESFEPVRSVETVWDVFFALDILITFNVALQTKNGIVARRKDIFISYVASLRFWIDLMATVPFDDVWVAISSGDGVDSLDEKISSALGLLRMLRVNRLLILFREMQASTKFNLLGVVVSKFVLFILLCTHTSGCIFYALASYADFGSETWVHKLDPSLPTTDLANRYIHVLFWAVGTFKAGPAHSGLSPHSNSEMILACLAMMLNICLQTYLVSNMAALLTTADIRIYAMRNHLHQLEQFSKRYDLPRELRHQLRTAVRFKFASDQELDETVLSGLPELYRQRISHVLYEEIISKIDLFRDCAPLFLRRLHGSFKSTLYMPDQQLVNIDEPSSQLQILCEGEAEMCDRSGGLVCFLSRGESFTSISFLCKVGNPFSVRTRTVCRVLSLDHASWDLVCQAFPDNFHQVKVNLLQYCEAKTNEYVDGAAGQMVYKDLTHIVQTHLVQERETAIALFCAAAARGDMEEIKRIMIFQTPDCSNYDSRTPLHLAAANGQVEAVSLLLDNKAFVDPVDNFGRTPLLEACRCKQVKSAHLLHMAGAILGSGESREGGSSMSKKSKDGVEKLTAAGELCQAASDAEELWYLKMLLKYGADPNDGDYDARTALHVACASGNKSAVELLIGYRGINLNPQDNFGRTPLMEAVRHGHEHVARLLKAHGAFHGFVVDLKDNTDANAIPAGGELCQAAFSNQVRYLNNLLSFCDLDVDAADYDLRTALMLACAEGNMGIAVHLVQNGADINKKDRWGHTPITEAIDHGHPELADVLKQIVKNGRLKTEMEAEA